MTGLTQQDKIEISKIPALIEGRVDK